MAKEYGKCYNKQQVCKTSDFFNERTEILLCLFMFCQNLKLFI